MIKVYLKKIISNQTLMFTIGGFLPALLNLIFIPIFTRILSPEDFGIYAYTNAAQSILIVFSTLAIDSYLLRFYFDKDVDQRKEMFGTIFIFLTLMNFALLGLLYFFMPLVVSNFVNNIPFKPYFLLMILTVFFEYMFMIPQVIWRVNKQANKFVIFSFSKMFLIQCLAFIMIVNYETGIVGRYLSNFIVNIIFALAVITIILKHSKIVFRMEQIKEALKFAIPILPAALLSIIYNAMDKLILGKYFSLTELGLYSIASVVGFAILLASMGYYKAVEPVIFQNYENPDFKIVVKNINKFQILSLYSISLIIVLFSEDLTRIFFSEKFINAFIYIPYFLIAFSFNASRNIVGTVLHAYKITKYDFLIVLIAMFTYILSFQLLVPMIGIMGALYALIISSFFALVGSMLFLSRISSLEWYLMPQAIFSLIILFIAYVNESFIFFSSILGTLIKVFFVIIYLYFAYKYLKKYPELLPN